MQIYVHIVRYIYLSRILLVLPMPYELFLQILILLHGSLLLRPIFSAVSEIV